MIGPAPLGNGDKPLTPNQRARATILLVEDDGAVRAMLAEVLRLEGYRIVEADTGASALHLAETTVPDLIVTDILMDDIDGVELIGRIRQHLPAVPIISMSGGGRIGAAYYLDISEQLGANAAFQKPFDNDALLAAIARLLLARDDTVEQPQRTRDGEPIDERPLA